APSADLVARLLDDTGAQPLRVIATRARGKLNGGAHFERIEIEPLSPDAISELVHQALGDASESLVSDLLALCDGLPLHVEQVLRYIAEGGGEPYLSLPDTIGARIARLPQEARTLLQVVALAGGEAETTLLAGVDVDDIAGPMALL